MYTHISKIISTPMYLHIYSSKQEFILISLTLIQNTLIFPLLICNYFLDSEKSALTRYNLFTYLFSPSTQVV